MAKGNAKWNEKYVAGDMNSSLIRTAKGRTILLQHDVSSPRPYTRLNGVAGTKGVFEDYPARIYVEGQEGGLPFGSRRSVTETRMLPTVAGSLRVG